MKRKIARELKSAPETDAALTDKAKATPHREDLSRQFVASVAVGLAELAITERSKAADDLEALASMPAPNRAEGMLQTLQRAQDAPDIKRGRKVAAAARAGHEAVHGSAEAKAARWAEIRAHYKAIRENWQFKSDAIRRTAQHFGVSGKTVTRAFQYVGEPIP